MAKTPVWRIQSAHLPIIDHLDAISVAVEKHRVLILEAPPGSGKTTLLPLHLLEQPWLAGKKIVMLQPRRIATKGVASRMSELLGESVGETVGYQMRLETRTSKATRIEIVTEGLLTRRLLSDSEMPEVGLIIFDEFHERSLHADVALALTKEVSESIREDLRIIVMSATLGNSLPDNYFSSVAKYTFKGTPFDVEVKYQHELAQRNQSPRQRGRDPMWSRVARAIRAALDAYEGDVLVFLPGAFEIERTRELIESAHLPVEISVLHGDLPYSQQQRALLPSESGQRKVVLSTTIAETSLTIEGIRIVIDAGYHKVLRYDGGSAISRLSTERITQDAADQRAGRAGRTAPGVCIRLWSEEEHRTLRPNREPEVMRADLASPLLDLAVWGVRNFAAFCWITPPPFAALQQATKLLVELGALTIKTNSEADLEHVITDMGRHMCNLGTQPRLARMAIEARARGLDDLAAKLIPLLEERDLLAGQRGRGRDDEGADINARLELLERAAGKKIGSLQRMSDLIQRWHRRISELPRSSETVSSLPKDSCVGFLLAIAFPDRIARRRLHGGLRYLLSSGKGVVLRTGDPLQKEEYLVVCEMHDSGDDGRVFLASSFDEKLLFGPLAYLLSESDESTVDRDTGELRSEIVVRCGAILVKARRGELLSPADKTNALARWLETDAGFGQLPWSSQADSLRARVSWARSVAPESALMDMNEAALRLHVSHWLEPYLPAGATISNVSQELLFDALWNSLEWKGQQCLEQIAPENITLPSGRIRRIKYSNTENPILEAMVQDLFGWRDTPTIGSKRIPLTLHILSPARRPIQVTRDLASFWLNGYPQVRKELRGRYPKHKWPEDPHL